jgi:hypothetical protein
VTRKNKTVRRKIVNGGIVPSSILAAMLKDSTLELSNITLEKATEQYEKNRDLEWKRLSTTQTSS